MSTEIKNTIPLSKRAYYILCTYYSILFIISIFSSSWIFLINHATVLPEWLPSIIVIASSIDGMFREINILSLSLLGSMSTSLMGCSICYIKKLYKLVLSDNLIIESDDKLFKFKSLASSIYFLFRPIYAICFSFILLLGINSGMLIITSSTLELNNTFCDMIMFISFFIGFSTGRFLDALKAKSEKIVDDTLFG